MLKKLFNFKDEDDELKLGKLIGVCVGCLAILIFVLCTAKAFWPFVVIQPGTRGVMLNFGSVQDVVLDEGLHMRVPIMQKVVRINVQIMKEQGDAAAASKDLQNTTTVIALNYHILPEKANWIYQKIGVNVKETIIDPAIQECVKAVTSQFNAAELITQRELVKNKIKEILKKRLLGYNIVVDDFAIVNFAFSNAFQTAIEQKQAAEQNALTAKNKLEQVKFEAEQKVTAARAEAEALRLQKENVTPQLIALRQIEMLEKHWDGALPLVMSGGNGLSNIIDMNQLQQIKSNRKAPEDTK